MLTLSLVFEDRDRDGMLTHYERFDLTTPDALYFCGTMAADDGWYTNMPDEDELELRWKLIDFINVHDPDALSIPAKTCPTCGGVMLSDERGRCKNETSTKLEG
jgi:hypothetical protein